jgi:putative inorganic carbon (hco3(-)) transporter
MYLQGEGRSACGVRDTVRLRFEPRRIPFYLTWIVVVSPLCSITAMNVAIAVAFAALVVWRLRYGGTFRYLPVKLPLAAFFGCTVLSIALSGHVIEGWEGIRKFYLFLVPLLVMSTVRSRDEIWSFALGMAGMTSLSAVWSLAQFVRKYEAARAAGIDFRLSYTAGERITGFMSHWMTLSGEEMIVLLVIASLAMWGAKARTRWFLGVSGGLIAISLAAGYTRSMWLGAALGSAYLAWYKDRRWLIAGPAAVVLLVALNPAGIGGRIVSIWRPAGVVDSNLFRVICRRTAIEMVKAHPWFGVGPGQVRPQFLRYIPADIPRPLPPGAYIHMHNTYLQYAAERGLPALAALLWWLAAMLRDFLRAARRAPGDWVLRGTIAVMVAVLAAGWYEHNLGNGAVMPLFLAVCACGYWAADPSISQT